MKQPTRLSLIGFFLFFSIVATIFLIARPVIKEANKQIQITENQYLSLISEKTGISISYKSLSPSILSGLRLSSIELYDKKTKKQIAQIDSLNLKWNILKMLGGDFSDAIGNLIISGVHIEYNDLENSDVREKIIKLISSNASSNSSFSLPFDIIIKKTNIIYSDENIKFTYTFSQLNLSTQKNTNFLAISSRGALELKFLKGKQTSLGSIHLDYFLQGRITPDITNSYVQFSIHDLDCSLFYIDKLDFNASYNGSLILMGMIRNGMSFEITGSYDIDKQIFSIQINSENFKPFSVVNIKDSVKTNLSSFYDTSISGAYSLTYDANLKKIAYTVNGSILIPNNLINGGANLDVNLTGTEQQLSITNLSIVSQTITANYIGSFNITKLLPQGTLSIERLELPSGNILSTDIYISPMQKGFLCFIPQLFLGNSTLTAIQLNLILQKGFLDFTFEAYDYSNSEISGPGKISFSGNYAFYDNSYIQTQISVENFLGNTVFNILEWGIPLLDIDIYKTIKPLLKDYIFTFDTSIDSDFKHLNYDTPYFIAANIYNENKMLLLSFDGTEDIIRLSQFTLLYNNQKITANINVDFSDFNEIFFSSQINFNSIPYNFFGVYAKNKTLKISGDYNLNVNVKFPNNPFLEGSNVTASISMVSLPIIINDYNFLIEMDSDFSLKGSSWSCLLKSFSLQEISNNFISNPRLQLSGTLDNYGFTSSYFMINDNVATLEGTLGLGWDFSNSILHSSFLNLSLGQKLSPESVNLSISASNPENFLLQNPDFISNLFFDVKGTVTELQIAHFKIDQTIDDTLTCSINALGSIDMPSVQVMIEKLKTNVSGGQLNCKGPIMLKDKDLIFDNISLWYNSYYLNNFTGSLDLETMIAEGTANLDGALSSIGVFATKTFNSPVSFKFTAIDDESNVNSKKLHCDILLTKLRSSFLKNQDNFPIHIEKNDSGISFSAGKTNFITFFLDKDGNVTLTPTDDFPIQFYGDGYWHSGEKIFIQLHDLNVNASFFTPLLNFDIFTLISGQLTGDLSFTYTKNLLMNGNLIGKNIVASVPYFLDENFTTDLIHCEINDSIFAINDITVVGQDLGGTFLGNYSISVQDFASVVQHIDIKNLDNIGIKASIKLPIASFTGIASTDLNIDISPNLASVKGAVSVDDLETILNANILNTDNINSNEIFGSLGSGTDEFFNSDIDLTIDIDPKTQVFFPSKENPIINGLVGVGAPIQFKMNTEANTYSILGDLIIKGGQILYVNRTFYLKEGKITLDSNQDDFDPILTFQAEIREDDDDGETIKILLTAKEQKLSQLAPIISSSPSKTQEEIMSLLGDAIFVDVTTSDNVVGDLLTGALDYAIQIGFSKRAENALRDFFNFDIFSFRTTFLQNAVEQAFNDDATNNITFGNYLDGSTVYIGKYIGNTLYADMMLEIVYDTTLEDGNTKTGLGLQPEFGIELPSPFATIRWSIAPEANSDWNLLVPYTSISLSWEFMF